jgi:hypothetical protein
MFELSRKNHCVSPYTYFQGATTRVLFCMYTLEPVFVLRADRPRLLWKAEENASQFTISGCHISPDKGTI